MIARGAGGLAIVALLFILGSYDVQGQAMAVQTEPDDGWSIPVDLAVGRPGRALFPTMIADAAGGIHVFWTETVEVDDGQRHSVVYTYGNENGWAGPLDVFVSRSQGGSASDARAVVDDRGMMHAVWSDGAGVMYAQRHVYAPVSAQAWTRPRVIGGTLDDGLRSIQIAQDGQGTLHAVFTGSDGTQTGAYYLRSSDRGRTWTGVHLLAEDVLGGRFRLHLLWHEGALHLAAQSARGVRYLRSDDGGTTWPTTTWLEETGNWPQLVALERGRLLLLTVGTVRDAYCMKLQNRSPDNGQSWEEISPILLPARGCLGNAPVQQDSAGNRHLVMTAYLRPAYVDMVWHSVWDEGQWRPAEPLLWSEQPYESLGTQPDFPSAAISTGNRLHALFVVDEGHIWYTQRDLPAPAIPAMVYPTPTLAKEASTIAVPTATPATAFLPPALASAPPDPGRALLAYLLPILASLAVVGCAILWERRP